jgi:hypothetical protein
MRRTDPSALAVRGRRDIEQRQLQRGRRPLLLITRPQ